MFFYGCYSDTFGGGIRNYSNGKFLQDIVRGWATENHSQTGKSLRHDEPSKSSPVGRMMEGQSAFIGAMPHTWPEFSTSRPSSLLLPPPPPTTPPPSSLPTDLLLILLITIIIILRNQERDRRRRRRNSAPAYILPGPAALVRRALSCHPR